MGTFLGEPGRNIVASVSPRGTGFSGKGFGGSGQTYFDSESVPVSASSVSSGGGSYSPSSGGDSMTDVINQIQQIADANTARAVEISNQQAEATRQFNMQEAAKNRDWQEMMSNTAHQREVRDLMAAGLNPVLSAMNGNGATVGSGAAASSSMPNSAEVDRSASQSIAGLVTGMMASQATMAAASTSAAGVLGAANMNLQGTRISADAQRYSAELQSGSKTSAAGISSSINALGNIFASALRFLK